MPRAINDFLVAKTRLIGSQGLVGTVLAGIDMAAWDALARHHETSVCRLLGGQHKPIMAYAGTGYDGELETARQAEAWVKQGYIKPLRPRSVIRLPQKIWPLLKRCVRRLDLMSN